MRSTFIFIITWCALTSFTYANSKHVVSHGDWHVYTYQENGQVICHAWSLPVKEEGNYTKRGDVYAFITNRPTENIKHEVSFAMGYPVKNIKSKLSIDNKASFKFFSYGEAVFLNEPRTRELINNMKRGNIMRLFSVSKRGTKTKDTYSLKGVSKAISALDKACR